MKVKEDNTSFSLNAGASLGAGGAGATLEVNGKSSAFALISAPGTLDPEGRARQAAEAIAEKQAQQKFGFAGDNPYGTECPNPDLTLSLSIP